MMFGYFCSNWLLIFLRASFAGGLAQLMILRVTCFPPPLSALVVADDPVEPVSELALVPLEVPPLDVVLLDVVSLGVVVPFAPEDVELQPAAATIARAVPSPMTVANSLRLIMKCPFVEVMWVGPPERLRPDR